MTNEEEKAETYLAAQKEGRQATPLPALRVGGTAIQSAHLGRQADTEAQKCLYTLMLKAICWVYAYLFSFSLCTFLAHVCVCVFSFFARTFFVVLF